MWLLGRFDVPKKLELLRILLDGTHDHLTQEEFAGSIGPDLKVSISVIINPSPLSTTIHTRQLYFIASGGNIYRAIKQLRNGLDLTG